MQRDPVHLHTLCWDLSQLYEFCHTSQSTRASLESECNKYNCQKFLNNFTWASNKLTSASASLGGKPTTNTKFFCTTRTFAKCLRFSEIFCFRCWSRCRFSAFSAEICTKKNNTSNSFIFYLDTGIFFPIQSDLPALEIAAWSQLDFRDRLCDTQDTIHFHPFGFGASRIGRFGSHTCMDRN